MDGLLALWLVIALPLGRTQASAATLPVPAFTAPVANPFGLASVALKGQPLCVDIDGDGDLDCFVGSFTGDIQFHRNTGSATSPAFAAASTNPFGLADAGSYSAPAAADLDGDGDLDLWVGRGSGDILLFENTGSATSPAFASPVVNPFGLQNLGSASVPAIGDVDGDGDLDVLVGTFYGNTFFFRNTGSATSPAFAAGSLDPFGFVDVGDHSCPTLSDLDGDGDLDAWVGNQDGDTLFLRNTGTPLSPAFAVGSANPYGLADVGSYSKPTFADVDGDGDLDAFVADVDGNTQFFANTQSSRPDPLFLSPSSTNPFGLANAGTDAVAAFADLDGDGDLDCLVGTSSSDLRFFPNVGSVTSPAFAAPTTNPFGLTNAGSIYAAPAIADLDGDGDLDVVVGNFAGSVRFYENTGSAKVPVFALPTALPGLPGSLGSFVRLTIADLDGDGDPDLLTGQINGTTSFFRNTGTATSPAFAAGSANPFGFTPVAISAPVLADLDGDGDLDAIVGAGNGAGNTLFFRNSGSSTSPAFAPASTNPFGIVAVYSVSSPRFVDIDGDGDLDAFIEDGHGNAFFWRNGANQLIFLDGFESGTKDDWAGSS